MAARGGARPGAGRKRGSLTKRTQEIAARASAEGITPLEVMLGAMREAWEKGEKKEAAAIAKDAAPFVHPRLSSVEAKVDADIDGSLAVSRIELVAPSLTKDETSDSCAPAFSEPFSLKK
jgi:hypothetical protein